MNFFILCRRTIHIFRAAVVDSDLYAYFMKLLVLKCMCQNVKTLRIPTKKTGISQHTLIFMMKLRYSFYQYHIYSYSIAYKTDTLEQCKKINTMHDISIIHIVSSCCCVLLMLFFFRFDNWH